MVPHRSWRFHSLYRIAKLRRWKNDCFDVQKPAQKIGVDSHTSNFNISASISGLEFEIMKFYFNEGKHIHIWKHTRSFEIRAHANFGIFNSQFVVMKSKWWCFKFSISHGVASALPQLIGFKNAHNFFPKSWHKFVWTLDIHCVFEISIHWRSMLVLIFKINLYIN